MKRAPVCIRSGTITHEQFRSTERERQQGFDEMRANVALWSDGSATRWRSYRWMPDPEIGETRDQYARRVKRAIKQSDR